MRAIFHAETCLCQQHLLAAEWRALSIDGGRGEGGGREPAISSERRHENAKSCLTQDGKRRFHPYLETGKIKAQGKRRLFLLVFFLSLSLSLGLYI